MKLTKKHTIFIDTKLDTTQNPSNFNVRLNNWFVRNNIKNNDGADNEWFLSVKTFSMFNSFSNITTGSNDKVVLYVAKTLSAGGLNAWDYTKHEITIPPGNPNVINIQDFLNNELNAFELECAYQDYDSKYLFRNKQLSTDKKKKFIEFENTYDLFGMTKGKYYALDNNAIKTFKSDKNVNLMDDRLVKMSLGTNSDIRLRDMHFCNHMNVYDECNHFFLMPVNVASYELMYYQRISKDLIPIELLGNSIRNIEILARNQNGDIIEGLNDYIMVLELIQVKTWNYEKKIYNVLKEIYMWIASYLQWRI
jgi:hypothetical protein